VSICFARKIARAGGRLTRNNLKIRYTLLLRDASGKLVACVPDIGSKRFRKFSAAEMLPLSTERRGPCTLESPCLTRRRITPREMPHCVSTRVLHPEGPPRMLGHLIRDEAKTKISGRVKSEGILWDFSIRRSTLPRVSMAAAHRSR
jgi:hypothetical protein